MANDEAEHNAARMLGCEISDDPLNPLLPIMQACRNHHPCLLYTSPSPRD